MKKSDNSKNNIFKWATKELSQDAIVAWLLNSNLGTEFVKDLLGKECPDKFDIVDIETQKNSIDVLVTLKVKVNDDYECQAIIIEDKTNTFLHNNQMLRYIETVSKMKKCQKQKYTKIYFVLFKTGTLYGWEGKEYERQKSFIDNKEVSSDGHKKFSIDELNDCYPETKLIISGGYNKKVIDLTNSVKIVTTEIYTLDTFKKFLGEVNGITVSDSIFSLIKDYYDQYDADDDKYEKERICEQIYKFLLDKYGEKYAVRMIVPGGAGKRDYDICIHCEDYIKYKESEVSGELEEPGQKSDNYLILPFIRFIKKDGEDLKLEFSVNYNIISDLKKLHGYQPFSEMRKVFNNLKWYEEAQDELRKKLSGVDGCVSSNKDNQLKFISWTVSVENNIESIVKENVKQLLDDADIIRKILMEE